MTTKPPPATELTILGGGIAGISAAYHALERNISCNTYEASAQAGGLASSFEVNGFRFDNAIHLSFTESTYVRSIFDQTPYHNHQPHPYCYESGLWLKHPVQNNLYPLTPTEKTHLVSSLIDRPIATNAGNYKQWLEAQYGRAITDRYYSKYTRKYWSMEADQLSLSWLGKRFRQPNLTEVIGGALAQNLDNHYYAKEMRYPKQGGYERFLKPMLDKVNIHVDHKITAIDTHNKTISFANRQHIPYKKIISTLPLPTIVDLILNCPKHVHSAAKELLYTTVDLISLGFTRPDIPPYLWFYIYDESIIPARAYAPNLKSAANTPVGTSALQFEIYNLSTKPKLSPDGLITKVKSALVEMGICSPHDILFAHHKHLPFANVVFDHGMEDKRQIVRDYLKQIGILTCGRFGDWDYYWSDQSLLSAKHIIDSIPTDTQ